MGGEGSGRVRETETVSELVMGDDDFKEALRVRTVVKYFEILDELESIIRREKKEYVFDSKCGVMIERPTPVADVVKAAKVWKEMTLDKVISDKKVVDNNNQGSLFDYLSAAKTVENMILSEQAESKKMLESEAAQKGKLIKLGGGI